MSEPYAKIVADSISPLGDRVTSIEMRFHRFVLDEANTHTVWARNSASSRAIPVAKQLAKYRDDPALPIEWPCEQKGMSGGAQLEDEDLERAQGLWEDVRCYTSDAVAQYLEEEPDPAHRLHKSLLNRLLEPMQWHTALVTATAWENFFDQRRSPAAMPEFRVVAELVGEAMAASTPVELERGQWHLPYIHDDEKVLNHMGHPALYGAFASAPWDGTHDAREISAARCARLSYETQDGRRDLAEDQRLYDDTLLAKGHGSPLQHVCTPWARNVEWVDINDPDDDRREFSIRVPRVGNFAGWQTWRTVVEAIDKIVDLGHQKSAEGGVTPRGQRWHRASW